MPVTRRRPERTQQERSETTTRALLDAARALFAADGYRATSLDEVASKAGVTKGALYHHFDGKEELFRAVFEREQRRLAATVAEAFSRERDAWDGLFAGCRSFLEASLDAGVQRITLLDAPGVLGWETMRQIEAGYALRLLEEGLKLCVAQGHLAKRPIAPLAHLLVGAVCEGAMMAARAEDPRAATRQILTELQRLLDGLRA